MNEFEAYIQQFPDNVHEILHNDRKLVIIRHEISIEVG